MTPARPLRCWIAGRGGLARECAELLRARGHALVVASDDPTIQAWSRRARIPLHPSWDAAEAPARLREADVLFSIANGWILDPRALAAPARGCINFHNGPLPRYAGVHATSWAILHGEAMHGIAWHAMDEGIDRGDVLLAVPVPIDPDETTETLNLKCHEAGLRSFPELLAGLTAGTLARRRQDRGARTYWAAHQKPPGAGFLRWDRPAEELHRTWRALQFGPQHNGLAAAKAVIGDRAFLIGALAVGRHASGAAPGVVISASRDRLRVATATQDVVIGRLAHPDGRPAPALPPAARLPLLDDAAAERLARLAAQASVHEAAWLRRLRRADPLAPIAAGEPAAAPPDDAARAEAPAPADLARWIAAAALVGRRLLGGGLLYQDEEVRNEPWPRGLCASLLPLAIELDDRATLGELKLRAEQEVRSARARRPLLADLVARSPALRRAPPGFPAAFVVGAAPADDPGPPVALIFLLQPGADATRLEVRSRRAPARPAAAQLVRLWLELGDAIDRRPGTLVGELPAPAPRPPAAAPRPPFVPPATAIERRIALGWTAALGARDVGLQDDFFALGGDARLARELAGALGAQLGIELLPEDLTDHPTIEALAPLVERRARGRSPR